VRATAGAEAAQKVGKPAEACKLARIVAAAEEDAGNAYRRRAQAVLDAVGKKVDALVKQASVAKDLTVAARLFRQALRIDPAHEPARKGMKSLGRKAQILYSLALNFRHTKPKRARTLLQQVLAVMPPDDSTHKKAKELIRKLK